jgi:hypothetical protein
MNTPEFLAKIFAVNWVERDYKRRIAVAAKAVVIWAELVAVIKDSVDTFNRLYKKDAQQIECAAVSGSVLVSFQLPLIGAPGTVELRKHARAMIGLNGGTEGVLCVYEDCPSALKAVTITFQSDGDNVFMEHDGKKIDDSDSASKIMLGKFLKQFEKA